MKTVEFPVESIVVNNLSDKMKISYLEVEELHLQFSGSQDALGVLDVRNAVSIDLKNYHMAGTYEVPVSVALPDSVKLVRQPTIKIVLKEKEEDEE